MAAECVSLLPRDRLRPSDDDTACACASAKGAIEACNFLASRGVPGFTANNAEREEVKNTNSTAAEQDREKEKHLSAFYHQAYKGKVDKNVVARAVVAYVEDKFERRVDSTCCLLHAARLAGFTFRGKTKGCVRVASIGGGPGNDAVGLLVYHKQQPEIRMIGPRINLDVYDFCAEWEPIVRSVGNAFKCGNDQQSSSSFDKIDVRFDFNLADLITHTSDPINKRLLVAAPETDVFIFSNVCHETRAWEHTMLPEILRLAPPGSLFLFVDLWKKDLKCVNECILQVGSFKTMFLGSSQAFPFKALVAKKATGAGHYSQWKFSWLALMSLLVGSMTIVIGILAHSSIFDTKVGSRSSTFFDPLGRGNLQFQVEGNVRRVSWHDRQKLVSERTLGYGAEPIVFTDSPVRTWDALRLWTPKYLSSYRDLKLQRVTMLKSMNNSRDLPPYIYPNYGRPLLKIVGEKVFKELLTARGQQRELRPLPIAKFFFPDKGSSTNAWTISGPLGNKEKETMTKRVAQGWSGDFERLESDLGESLEWMQMTNDSRRRHQIWMADAGTSTQIHYDHSPNLVAQIKGRKQFLLARPSVNLPIFPRTHPWYSFGASGIYQTDTVDIVPVVNATLEPGELLYLPAFMYHHVSAMEGEIAVGLNKFSSTGHLESMLDAPLPNTMHNFSEANKVNRWFVAWKYIELVLDACLDVESEGATQANIFLKDLFNLRYAFLFSLKEDRHWNHLDSRCHTQRSQPSAPLAMCAQDFGLQSMQHGKFITLDHLLQGHELTDINKYLVSPFRELPYKKQGGERRLLLADYIEDLLAYVVGAKSVCWFLYCIAVAL